MKTVQRLSLIAALTCSLATTAAADEAPFSELGELPPLPALMPADAEPLGTPVDPSDVANGPAGPAPAAGSNRSGAPAPGTDNRTAPPPAPGASTPNLPDINRDTKPTKSGLKGQDNPKGANDQTKAGKKGQGADTSNRDNRKRTPNGPGYDLPPDENNAAPYGADEEIDNGALSGMKGAGGKNGKQPTGRNNPGGGRRGGGARGKFPPLTSLDESMDPDFDPPGMPQLPSKCAEDSDCLPCFDEATAAMDKQRVNLEKLRSIYDYTHKFTREGTEFLSAAGASGGGLAQMGAAAEVRKVNGALDDFDERVRKKATELLGNLDTSVKQMAECEATYMDDDAWYGHHGQVYLQFMKGHYAF